jgi:transcription elongation GreA/GreB family factor
MDKAFLVEQLTDKLKAAAESSIRFAATSQDDARSGAGRAVNLARATRSRMESAQLDVEMLAGFQPQRLRRGEPIGLGALVEIEDGSTGKTLFLAPCGAGVELCGPDGDGVFYVVSPEAPLGKALLGKRVGDIAETMVAGELTEWTITHAE